MLFVQKINIRAISVNNPILLNHVVAYYCCYICIIYELPEYNLIRRVPLFHTSSYRKVNRKP